MSAIAPAPVKTRQNNKVLVASLRSRIDQLDSELNRVRSNLFYTDERLAVANREVDTLQKTLASLRQVRNQEHHVGQQKMAEDDQLIRDLRAKVETLTTQLSSIGSVINAAQTLVTNTLPKATENQNTGRSLDIGLIANLFNKL